jgi:isoleucyl-tRNA synthetase
VRDEKGEEMHKSKGNAIPFEDAAEEMGVDVMRWVFCRSNPATNINFGYGPADDIRNRFVLKLWNTYAFFCNYARLDGFDPGAPAVPVSERPDIDRWILSDLQLLIRTARSRFEDYDVMAFCLAAENFVAEKLSNWYVRRNRRRFWKSEKTADKLAAYQTLYTVLTTLVGLFAPVMPFLTEVMYRNLERGKDADAGRPDSVHLRDFPTPDDALIDPELSADMEALLRLVSLGSAVRNSVRIRVRQPLAEIRIQPANDAERRAVLRFGDQISEELNVKRVSLHDPAQEPLLSYGIRLNLKTVGPKLGERLKEAQEALAATDTASVVEKLRTGRLVELLLSEGKAALDQGDIIVDAKAAQGWAGLDEYGTQIMLDTRISDELACEGTAREIVRHIQELRKKSGLEIEDRIRLHLKTDSADVRRAIAAHEDYIRGETLAVELADEPVDDLQKATIKLQGQPLTIQLTKTVAP